MYQKWVKAHFCYLLLHTPEVHKEDVCYVVVEKSEMCQNIFVTYLCRHQQWFKTLLQLIPKVPAVGPNPHTPDTPYTPCTPYTHRHRKPCMWLRMFQFQFHQSANYITTPKSAQTNPQKKEANLFVIEEECPTCGDL